MGRLSGTIVPVTPFQQNCTILFDDETKDAVVVDPGGDVDNIVAAIEQSEVTVGAIWLTHGHIDHAAGAPALKRRLGVEILGPHRDDEDLLAALPVQAQMFGIPEKPDEVVPDRWLHEGDTLQVGEHAFAVLHTPGHAPGHVVFVNHAARFAHLGDVLFRGSIGRTDLPGGDHDTLLRSIRDKVLPLGDEFTFICGHGPGSSIGDERRTNPFVQGMR